LAVDGPSIKPTELEEILHLLLMLDELLLGMVFEVSAKLTSGKLCACTLDRVPNDLANHRLALWIDSLPLSWWRLQSGIVAAWDMRLPPDSKWCASAHTP